MTQISSLRMALCLCVVLSACARQSGLPGRSNPGQDAGAQAGQSNNSDQSQDSKATASSGAAAPNDASAPAEPEAKAEPNFFQRFLSHLGDNIGGLASAAVQRPTAQDKVRAEASKSLVAKNAERRAQTEETIAPINENAPALTQENAALLGDSKMTIRQKFIAMLTAPNLAEAIVKADAVTSDLWSHADQAPNKFENLTDTIGLMENLKIYDRASAQRVAVLTAKIDRSLKRDESSSALAEVAAVAVLGGGLALGSELNAIRRIEIENFKNGIGESAVGHALRGTHGFSEYAASHGHDIVIPMLAASEVELGILRQLQIRVIDGRNLDWVKMTATSDPNIQIAIIKQTRLEHLGTDRAILLKVKPDGVGDYQYMVTQRLSYESAQTLGEGLIGAGPADLDAVAAQAAHAEASPAEATPTGASPAEATPGEAATTKPRPRAIRLAEADAKNVGIDLTDDVFARGGPEGELSRLEINSELSSQGAAAPAYHLGTDDIEIPLVENPAADASYDAMMKRYEASRARTDLPLWGQAKNLAKSPVTASKKLDPALVARNFALITIPVGALDYVAHQTGFGEGVVASDYFLESRLTPERIKELHAPVPATK